MLPVADCFDLDGLIWLLCVEAFVCAAGFCRFVGTCCGLKFGLWLLFCGLIALCGFG